MTGLENIVSLIRSYERLGKKMLKNGAVKFGKAPHLGSQAFIHELLPPCTPKQIATIEAKIGISLPESYRDLLLQHNGFDLYRETLSIYGYKDWDKQTEGQPYDVLTPNTYERPEWLPATSIIIGTYNWDGSFIVIDAKGRITVHDPDDGSRLASWASLDKYLVYEAKRLPKFFDEEGRFIVEDVNTVPSNS